MLEQNPENFRPRFLRLAVVNILSNIMIPLAGLVDTAFLGHLADIRYLTGVALATIIFNLIYRNCNFLRMGTTGPTAQAEGNSNQEAVILILLRNSLIALIIGLLLVALQHPLREISFSLISATNEVKEAGSAYFNARICGAPAALLNLVFIGWFLGREQSGKVLIISFIGNGINILLDYLLIVRWDWASQGAGAATAASQFMMVLIAIAFFIQENWWHQILCVTNKIFDLKAIKSLFNLNRDIWLRTIAGTLTIAAFNDISSALGTITLAINTLLFQVIIITFYFIEGLSFATESLAGNFKGQGKTKQLVPLLKLSGISSLGVGMIIASLFICAPDFLFALLTNHLEVIKQLHYYILWLFPVLAFSSLSFILDGYFLGLTQGAILRNGVIIGSLFGFVPLAIISWQFHSTHLLWLAMCFYMAVRFMALVVRVPQTIRASS